MAGGRIPVASLIRVEVQSHESVGGQVDPAATVDVAATNWLGLSTVTYTLDSAPKAQRKWDVVRRTTRELGGAADAVVVLAMLRGIGDGAPRMLLVKQFRPALDAVSVEMPAGLIDAGEGAEAAAIRELKEETGFVGVVTKVHGAGSLSPGLSSESVVLVEVDVVGAPGGQDLSSGENIEVVSVPFQRLNEALAHLEATEGAVIMHAVRTLATGLQLGASFAV